MCSFAPDIVQKPLPEDNLTSHSVVVDFLIATVPVGVVLEYFATTATEKFSTRSWP